MNDKGTKGTARFLSLLLAAALLLVLCACGKKGEPSSPTAAPAKVTSAPADAPPTAARADVSPTSAPAEAPPTAAPASGFDYGSLGRHSFSIEELDVREDIKSAILASKRLSGGSLLIASDGSLIYWGEKRNNAYAYYGEPVAGLYADASNGNILAVMEDGSVYNAVTLISADAGIFDVAWKTHSTNIDAYMLGKDGIVYYYEPYDCEFKSMQNDTKPMSAIARAGSYALFFKSEGGLASPGLLSSGSSGKWRDNVIDAEYWNEAKNAVVGACCYDPHQTVAAITADGTVYAKGSFADDILAMGDLSYITMDNETGLIVGLTTEGKLKFAGPTAGRAEENFRSEGDIRVCGLRLLDDTLWFIDAEGSIRRCDYLTQQCYWDIFTADGSTIQNAYRIDPAGDLYCADREAGSVLSDRRFFHYQRSRSINAGFAEHARILYYLSILDGKMYTSTGFGASRADLDKASQIALADLDADGTEELLILDDGGFMTFAAMYNGKLASFFNTWKGSMLSYPEAAIVVFHDVYSDGTYADSVWHFRKGHAEQLGFCLVLPDGWESTESHMETAYTCNTTLTDLPMKDEEGEKLRNGNTRKREDCPVSRAEFEAWLESLLGSREPVALDQLPFFSMSKEDLGPGLFAGRDPDAAIGQ